MNNDLAAHNSAWWAALYLPERKRFLNSAAINQQADSALATLRLKYWKSAVAFKSAQLFEERLATDEISESQLWSLLGMNPARLSAASEAPPEWTAQLASLGNPNRLPGLIHQTQHHATALVEAALGGLLAHAHEQLVHAMSKLDQRYPDGFVDQATFLPTLMSLLLARLTTVSSRVLVLELNIARLQQRLTGDTPEQRFDSFKHALSSLPALSTLLHEYPVLARSLLTSTDLWFAASCEFLSRLYEDWSLLTEHFFPEDKNLRLIKLESTTGDPHNQGRTVFCLHFTAGRRLIYKPRPVAAAFHFQELLAWINLQSYSTPFRLLSVLDRGDYGWIEFVPYQECSSPAEIQRFYQRLGGLLAILYTLGGTDFHRENLIAHGEFPMLIDLETLLRPQIRSAAFEAAFYDSVMAIGLLPHRMRTTSTSKGIDISGFGGQSGQLLSTAVWAAKGTDEMRIILSTEELEATQNRPSTRSEDVAPADYVQEVLEGFSEAYRLIDQDRQGLLAPDGPIMRFTNDSIRFLSRHTQDYDEILQSSFHPDVLRDGLDRERVLDHLWAGVTHNPELRQLIAAEREDLLRGDIPLFTILPDQRHIWASDGTCIEDFFSLSGIEAIYKRLNHFGPADLARQAWIIRMALNTKASWRNPPTGSQDFPYSRRDEQPDPQRLRRAATAIGDRLAALAWRQNGEATWIGPASLYDRGWSISGLGHDFYNGLPGIALFMAYLGKVTDQQDYTSLAREVMTALENILDHKSHTITDIGAFYGWGGLLYTYLHLGTLWSDQRMIERAQWCIEQIKPLISADNHLDIIAGSAGSIGALLAFHQRYPDSAALAVARVCGDHLVSQAQKLAVGMGWHTTMSGQMAWTGFSHGTAGMAWSLLALASFTGEEHYRTTALASIRYERSLFNDGLDTWTDLRPADLESHGGVEDNDQPPLTAWCNGAASIGLARLGSLESLDEDARLEIKTAIRYTLRVGFGENHSLCHGDLGNIELLVAANQHPGFDHAADINAVAQATLDALEAEGWKCGVPPGLEPPGLMVGLAGIGYGLLRLYDSAHVPSILLLEPPC